MVVRRTPIPPLPKGTPRRSLSFGPLPADLLTPPLWQCGVVTVLGGRWVLSTVSIWFLSGFCRRFLSPHILTNPRTHVLPMNPGCRPENVQFTCPLKDGLLNRIPSRTMAHPRTRQQLRGNVTPLNPHARWGCCLQGEGLSLLRSFSMSSRRGDTCGVVGVESLKATPEHPSP